MRHTDIFIRGVRESTGKSKKKSVMRKQSLFKGKKGKLSSRKRNNTKRKPESKPKMENKVSSGCEAFFTPSNFKDYKYARNLIQKAKRIKSSYSQLDKKHGKATTVFANATAFFKECPPGSDIYDKLRY